MNELRCPQCHTELMTHPANRCLNDWVFEAVYKKSDVIVFRGLESSFYSSQLEEAWPLMEKVWEINEHALICKDYIHLSLPYDSSPYGRVILGETFPLRACRAAIFLHSIPEEDIEREQQENMERWERETPFVRKWKTKILQWFLGA